MKKPIVITIPDTLTKEQEAIEVGYQLFTKALPDQKNLIGTGLEIKDLETTIIIKRESKEKPIEYVKCPVCGIEHQSNLFKKVFTNYGGVNKHVKVCSLNCAESLIDALGDGRGALSRSKLKPFRKFNFN